MKRLVQEFVLTSSLASLLIVPLPFLAGADDDDDDSSDEELVILSPFCIDAGGNFGAAPGGAQDINFFRMGAGRGQIPHPDSLTAEGLFSEHDLPLDRGTTSDALFRVETAAVPARFELLPDVGYLAQLGFSSGLQVGSWHRAPLNLVVVVDKSGSMSGAPLALVRAALHRALGHLEEGDQISVVLYGDRAHVHLAPTTVNAATRPRIAGRIDAIESAGSTFMEEGLRVGYALARESAHEFAGTTRVMLFTDERPNVGDTSAEGFMAMAEAASRDGVGLTTIGVGVQFGADLATRISSVRGGNLFFFEDGAEMTRTFAEDFDTMATELAYELSVRIEPAAGLRVAGVFGVPGEMLRWDGDAIVLDVATIFLSKRKGAIYFALSSQEEDRNLPVRGMARGAALAHIAFRYVDARAGTPVAAAADCELLDVASAQAGLRRGVHLIDEYLTLKKAAAVHLFDNDQEGAFRLVAGLLARLSAAQDSGLARECELVRDIHNTLALLSGHAGEIRAENPNGTASSIVGVWRRAHADSAATPEFLVCWPTGVLEPIDVDADSGTAESRGAVAVAGELPNTAQGQFAITTANAQEEHRWRFECSNDTLILLVPQWNGENESWSFERCSYSDLPRSRDENAMGEIDDFSGLPVSARTTAE